MPEPRPSHSRRLSSRFLQVPQVLQVLPSSAALSWGLGVAIVLGAGCLRPPPWKRIQGGTVVTPGVIIRAEDGSFTLRSGQRFKAPFHARDCVAMADRTNWRIALRWGARRVRVTVPGLASPLYGVLSLCEVHPTRAGPNGKSYDLKVPPAALIVTATGQTVVLVKETAYGRRFREGFLRFDAWQLWLSRYSFPE